MIELEKGNVGMSPARFDLAFRRRASASSICCCFRPATSRWCWTDSGSRR